MSEEPTKIDPGVLPLSFYARMSFAVTCIAAAWFGVELLLATGWRDAMIFHDAGGAISLVAVLLAVAALGARRGNRKTSWIALGLAVLAFAFFLFVVPL